MTGCRPTCPNPSPGRPVSSHQPITGEVIAWRRRRRWQVLKCAEEVVERLVCASGIAGGVEVHEETANDREDKSCELRPTSAAQAVLERPKPVGRCAAAEVGPQLLLRTFAQLAEHLQIRPALRAGHRGPGAAQGGGVGLVELHAQEVAEHLELSLPGATEDRAQQVVAAAKVVDQHAGRGASGIGQGFEPVGQAVLEGVVGARVEEPLLDLRLRMPAHSTIFSCNGPYVYRWSGQRRSWTRRWR